MVRWIWGVAGLGLLFVLTGCGGGGGGGGDSARALMTLSTENSPTVASTAWVALGDGDLLLDDGLLPLQVTGTGSGEPMIIGQQTILRRVTTRALDHLKRVDTLVPLGESGDSILLPQATEAFPCSVSGSVVIGETSATSGYVEFRNCMEFEEGMYVLLNGRVEVSNLQGSEGACVDSYSATVRFRDFSASIYEDLGGAELERVAIGGSANVSVVDNFCERTFSLRFQGSSLSFRTLNESFGYFDFDIRGEDLGAYWEDDIRVTLDVGSLPGSVRVTTPQRLRSFWYDDFPHAGQVRLTADRGGYLLARINASSGSGAVSIIGDFNNDGTIDCDAEVSWEQVVSGSWSCDGSSGGGVAPTTLESGQPITGSLAIAAWSHYQISVPPGSSSLEVDLSVTSGEVDLMVNFGEQPDAAMYYADEEDCWDYSGPTFDAFCQMFSPEAGAWYVSLWAKDATINSNYRLVATVR